MKLYLHSSYTPSWHAGMGQPTNM